MLLMIPTYISKTDRDKTFINPVPGLSALSPWFTQFGHNIAAR